MVGTIIVWIAFAAAALSAYAYARTAASGKRFLSLARNSYGMMAVGVFAASILLLVHILGHHFEYEYVWAYSSRALPLHLLITTFWAGQEGSFLLWTLCAAIIGIILMSYTRRKGIEAQTMSVYTIVQAFLLLLLIAKSPFQFVWDAHADQVAVGTIPQDGRGLNPLLQNFWMIAHPPVLFAGFAMMAVPFVFAMAALWRKTYTDWIPNALPWVIAGTIALGTGIMLGGYWAYGVLGWGGWWGWDPVENSSLIPWLIGIILIHTMLVQRKTGGLAKTNFFLGICTYVLVVYSTFLTRSGILGSASVHSFVDPGTLAYTLLIIWIGASLILGFGMLLRRWRDLNVLSSRPALFTRESFLAISSAVMGASALVILFGTSWPILSHASLEPSFYDKTNLPIAVALGLLLGLSLLVEWKEDSSRKILRSASAAFVAAAVGLVLLVVFGLKDILFGVFAFSSLFAFFVNAIRLYRLSKENLRFTGGAISHIGLTILFLGIIGSGRYGEKKTASLTLNEPKEVLGHQLTYTGSKPTADGKWEFSVKVVKEGSQFVLDPVMFQSDYNNSLMRTPDYAAFLTRDFYIEPVSLEEVTPPAAETGNVIQLRKGESKTIGDATVTFLRFDMDHKGAESMTANSAITIGAVLELKRGPSTEQLTAVTVYNGGQNPQPKVARTKDGVVGVELLKMNVDSQTKGSTIEISLTGLTGQNPVAPQKSELLVVEASIKPFMSLVWVGSLLMIVGLFISLSTKLNGVNSPSAQGPKSNRVTDGNPSAGGTGKAREKEVAGSRS